MQLTKAGAVFLEHVTRILDEVNRTELKMHQLATNGGRIDIAYVAPLARTFIPKMIRSFLHEDGNRHVIFNFHQGNTAGNVDGLKRGSYDHTSGLGKYTKNFFLSHDIHPEFICESPDENGIASLVAEGFGIALVADVEAIHRDDIVIRHLIPEETFSHTVYMGYVRSQYQLPALKHLIRFIIENCTTDQ